MRPKDTTTPQPPQQSPLDDLSGEPLADSGFEQETADPDFSDEQPDQL